MGFGDIIYWIYVAFAICSIILVLYFIIYHVVKSFKEGTFKSALYFEVLDEDTIKPVANLDVYGEFLSSSSATGRTASDELVWIYGGPSNIALTPKKSAEPTKTEFLKKHFFKPCVLCFF